MARNTRRAVRLDDGRFAPAREIPAPMAGDFDVVAVRCLDHEGRENTRLRVVVGFELGAEDHQLSLHPDDARALHDALRDALHVIQISQELRERRIV